MHHDFPSEECSSCFYSVSSAGSQEHPDSAPEFGEDAATSIDPSLPPAMTEEERQELQEELIKVSMDEAMKTQTLAFRRHLNSEFALNDANSLRFTPSLP